jgi:hypothetical protein
MSGECLIGLPDLPRCVAALLSDFDTHGQILTLGDKTTLFLAVFLKKVRVL